jgi:hypothetical protein
MGEEEEEGKRERERKRGEEGFSFYSVHEQGLKLT